MDIPLFADDDPIYGLGEIKRCPLQIITPITRQVMNVYLHCRSFGEYGIQPNGCLPVAGGVLDQSKTLMDAFQILDSVLSEIHHQDMVAERGKR